MISIKIKDFIKSFLIYGIGLAFNSLISFILIPVYTSYLIPSDFGVYSLILINALFSSFFI